MHYLAVVLLPRDTVDIEAAIERVMEPYYSEQEGPARKEYYDARGLQNLAKRYCTRPDNLTKIARKLHREFGHAYFVDEQGLYYITNLNPRGKYDYYSLHSLSDDVWPVAAMQRDLLPAAVVTPDGAWHDIEIGVYGWDLTPATKERIVREAYALIDQYPDHLAVRLDCHE